LAEIRSIGGSLEIFKVLGFEKRVQRRGTHVNTPEIGSRGAGFLFGGNLTVLR
jgi:hypothetical protein